MNVPRPTWVFALSLLSTSIIAQVLSPPNLRMQNGDPINITMQSIDYNSVTSIETSVNDARRQEEVAFGLCTNAISDLDLPDQATWDTYSVDLKGLILINDERRSRAGVIYPYTHGSNGYDGASGPVPGLPFVGVHKLLDDASEYWADYLTMNSRFSHCVTDTGLPVNLQCPHERAQTYMGAACMEGFALENLGASSGVISENQGVLQSILGWTYGTTGHRNGVLGQTNYADDNYGNMYEEGVIGLGFDADATATTWKSITVYKFVDTPESIAGCDYTMNATNALTNGCLRYIQLTSHHTGTYTGGNTTTITWTTPPCYPAGTNINILLSLDGGATFPITLAAATSVTDGSEQVILPAGIPNGTSTVRIRIESTGLSCRYYNDESDGDMTINSNCLLTSSIICPVDSMTFPTGDGGLNLSLTPDYFGAAVTSVPIDITGANPMGQLVNRQANANITCAQNWGVSGYQTFSFKVTQAGSYSFNYGANTLMFSLFSGTGYNPASPCDNWLQANNWGGIGWGNGFSFDLQPCVDYQLVGWAAFGDVSTTIDMSGPGTIYSTSAAPGTGYSYTYVAVDRTTNQISAFSSSADFTTLAAGDYLIYGSAYFSGAGTNPPASDPNGWINLTAAQVVGTGNCVKFSNNAKPLTITGCPANYNLSGAQNTSFDYETDGTIISTQTITGAITVDYDSKLSITCNALFEVQSGAVFNAYIDGCGGTN